MKNKTNYNMTVILIFIFLSYWVFMSYRVIVPPTATIRIYTQGNSCSFRDGNKVWVDISCITEKNFEVEILK
jgi:hypothetical protein